MRTGLVIALSIACLLPAFLSPSHASWRDGRAFRCTMRSSQNQKVFYETYVYKPSLNRVTLVKMESPDGTFMNMNQDYATQAYGNLVGWRHNPIFDYTYSQEYELNLSSMTIRSSVHTTGSGKYLNITGTCEWI